MNSTYVLFSVQMHPLSGSMETLILIKRFHVLNSHYQASIMTSIKTLKTCNQTSFFGLVKCKGELDSLTW